MWISEMDWADERWAATPLPAPTRAPAPVGALRVLVVDDDPDAAGTLVELLVMRGHVARSARDGVEALSAGLELQPDVALLDLSLPGKDGYEVARQMRQERWGHEMVLIAVTGWDRDGDHGAAENDFDHYFVKPVDPSSLFHLLGTLRR
ncbi:MAG TPA: response regulator [Candidatus Eisenbacteria bacterium]|nr:response regulator [Candidatus Eisenbacteria bacterium]